MSTPIRGTLTNAGTMTVGGEDGRTGLFIAMSEDELRAVPRLPMYCKVAVVEAGSEFEQLRKLREAVQFVIDHAGKEMETELGIIRCSELWMAEQLGCALDVTEGAP